MSTEHESKKFELPTELLTPAAQAATNQMISAAVQEAVKSVFSELKPVLESMAVTPEKMAEAERIRRMPTESEAAAKARDTRERKLMQEDAETNRQNLLRTQAMCPHRYPTGQLSMGIIRNYPDRQPRGVCMLCQSLFEPRHWIILAPDAEFPRGKPVIADAHPKYNLVLEMLATKG
jgi:CO dehydrogenase/acetyl-CoA synthase beta subunit